MSKWQTVYQSGILHQAEIVRAVLEEQDIQAVVVNKKDSSYHLGTIEVKVKPDHVIKAIKIIQDDISF